MTTHAADADRVSTPIEKPTLTQPYMNQLHPRVDTTKLLVDCVFSKQKDLELVSSGQVSLPDIVFCRAFRHAA
ncbi:hypothetical protein SNOG_14977 [Parastagonospora nodorum SN15]|uniref:Uncharacterized protein n=1 Tax=Phaeosphaeria nodorum (strain SN15 / ATCC MYA-4574 / FGSC 10173) TaxID=321614 RepID=Q0TZG3_PHANO|nr:hypothetical protein SNOG_14977 [Parastagonospora nodorum SN15]EAT77520.1 hypothetical protein SNOG_14977 [Parastagonospora nodorum SN15]